MMDYPDDYEELMQEDSEAKRIYRNNLLHPDPRDPDHDHGDDEDE